MVMEEVMSFVMEKLKEALLMMLNFGGQILLIIPKFVGQLIMKLVNFAGQGLLSLKNFGYQILLLLQKFFGQGLLSLKSFGWQMLLSLQNFFGQVPLMLKNLCWQALVTLKNFAVQALVTVKNFGVQALVTLKNFGGQALVALDNFSWQVKNLCGEIVSWFDEVFPPETSVEKINYWFHLALPYLIIALFLSLFILCCYFFGGLLFNVIKSLLKTVCDVLIKVMYYLKIACVGLISILKHVFTCCWQSKEPVIKMMKAPGRIGIKIARFTFENNPKLYFTNLRAGNV
ncbi:hypothetical protein K7X08_006622 [Anisodus acutangulus]|uniref:Uncharacterized protein n=1 Tax=Anisodus acutangulus TaxID=402998 RepID=A0A9Q1RSU7_9SOLA|nr:hypothetical protein K7X08_006622 [Anisodus acutangulus]